MAKQTKKATEFQVRQGDVLIERVSGLATGKPVPRESGRVVLAHGEATGHAHAIRAPKVELYELEDKTAVGDSVWSHLVRCLRVNREKALLEHEEHSTIELPDGEYRVTRQLTYTPAEIVPVLD